MKITSELIKLEICDTMESSWEILSSSHFFDSSFIKNISSAEQNYLLFFEQHCNLFIWGFAIVAKVKNVFFTQHNDY